MADPISIVNAALGELGESPLDSFDAQTPVAQLCRTHFADARDATLELAHWHFATFYAVTQRSATTPAFRWQYQYHLPTQPYCLTVIETDRGIGTRWEVGADAREGRVLFSNELDVKIAYVGRVENLNQWSSLALQVLIKVLASKLAKALTGQTSLEQDKYAAALALLPAAQQREARESGGDRLQVLTSPDLTLALWNEALGELGLPAIADLQDTTVLAQQLRTQYPGARDATLELAAWPFARFQATLVLSATVPTMRWTKQYRLPDDPYCLTVLWTNLGVGDLWEIGQHPIEGRVLYTEAASCTIEYIGRVTDLTHWNALGRQVLVKVLAAKVAHGLASEATTTGGASLARTKWDEAMALVPMAFVRHGTETAEPYQAATEATTATATALCQRALGELGYAQLHSIDELTVIAYHCRIQLPPARDSVLERHPWNFARRLKALSASVTVPAFKWKRQFDVPRECLTVLGTDGGNGAVWEIGNDVTDGRVLYSDATTVKIEYIFQQTDYTKWSALALEVLSKTLAHKVAMALSQALLMQAQEAPPELAAGLQRQAQAILTLGTRKWSEAQDLLRDARDRDAREGYPVVLKANTRLTTARHARGGVGAW